MLITSTDYANPNRPATLRLYNALARARPFAPLAVEELSEAACRATGLSDFGDPFFRPALDVLLESIEREAALHALGRSIVRTRLVGMLENRLRIERAFRDHPSIACEPLARPIVIAGLQRTGTTMLHRLLAADPSSRALLSWEALRPAPLPGEGRFGSYRRRAGARLAQLGLARLAPEFFAVHPVEADAPEEDILLLDHAFMSQASEAVLHVPTYARWLEGQSSLPAYRDLARILQLLHWQRAGEHWVLKTPHHLEYLGELLTVFPDALVVQTHRDPQVCVASFCSMVAHGRAVFSDRIEPREIGRHWLRKTRRMVDRSLAVRESAEATSFIDVSYSDLIADPLAQVERIYARAGRELSADARAAMQRVLARDVQHRYGRHVYSARDFGLSPSVLEETFADYRARFAIRHEARADAAGSPTRATGVGHRSLVAATFTAFVDMLNRDPCLLPVDSGLRLDGQTALVTGASSGLGKAVAIDLARRGAHLLLACRTNVVQARADIARASGSDAIDMLSVDLADLDRVVVLTDALARSGRRLDLVVCNAGLMSRKTATTHQGHDLMFGVHYLANHLLVRRLLASGVIPNDVYAANGCKGSGIPRIVFVASETHRSSDGLCFERLGQPVPFGMLRAIEHYSTSKLALLTFATELARRLQTADGASVGVHALCPGPIASRITREAPGLLEPVIDAGTRRLFRSPERAATPVTYLAAAPELAGETGWYLHWMRRKPVSAAAADPDNGQRLWEQGERMLDSWLRA